MSQTIKLLVIGLLIMMAILPASAQGGRLSEYAGIWKPTYSGSQIPEIKIEVVGDDAYVQIWGYCMGTPCDQGRVKAAVYGMNGIDVPPSKASNVQMFATIEKPGVVKTIYYMTLKQLGWPEDDPNEYRLTVEEFTSFSDNSKRYPFWAHEALKKDKSIPTISGYNPEAFRSSSYNPQPSSPSDLSSKIIQINPNPSMGVLIDPSSGELQPNENSQGSMGALPGVSLIFNPSMGVLKNPSVGEFQPEENPQDSTGEMPE